MPADQVSTVFAIGVCLVVGIGATWAAFAFRAGRRRDLARWYFDTSMPVYTRNNPFAYLPVAAIAFSSAAIIVAWSTLSHAGSMSVVIPGVLVFAISFCVGLSWLRHPPEELKPEWLKQEEVARGWADRPPETTPLVDRVLLGAVRLVGIGLLVIAVGLLAGTALLAIVR